MILETKNKKVELVLRTRKIVKCTNVLQGKNFEDVYMKAIQDNNIDHLSKIIFILAEIEGKDAFASSEEVYDFIDDYKAEHKKSYQDMFREIAEVINEEGFFINKMSQEELAEKISNPLSGMNMTELVQKSAEKAIEKVAEQEFQGFRA